VNLFPTGKERQATLIRGTTFLVEGLIHGRVTMIAGAPEAGKSHLTSSLAAALIRGEGEWLGHRVTGGPKRVVFGLTDPDGEEETIDRFDTLGVDHYAYNLGLIERNNTPEYWAGVLTALQNANADVFILDNLLGAIAGDINSQRDVVAFLDGLTIISRNGISVIACHHTAKPGQFSTRSPMGSRAFEAWTRSVIYLEKRKQPGKRVLAAEGNRQADASLTLTFDPRATAGDFFAVESVKAEAEIAADSAARKRTRDTATLDRNAEVARWVVSNCQGKGVRETAREVAGKFGGAEGTHASNLSGGRKYGTLLTREGSAWALAGPLAG
jgi:hypothetical protein